MKFSEKLKNIFLYLGMDKDTYERIEPKLHLENRLILLLMSAVVCFILVSMIVVNSLSSFLNTSSIFYIIGALTEGTVFVLCLTAAKRSPKIVPYLIEINLIVIYALCIGIATFGSSENEPTVTFFVVMILMPLLFIGKPLTVALTNIVATIVFIVLDSFKLPDVYSRDITNVMVYLVLSIVVSTWLIQTRAGNKKLLYDLDTAHRNLSESFGIVEALSTEYYVLFLADKSTMQLSLIRNSEDNKIPEELNPAIETQDYVKAFSNYIKTYVAQEDRERLESSVNPQTVLREIEEPGIYAVNYLRYENNGKSRYHQVAFANAGKVDGADKFVIGFRDVDDIVKEEQKKQQLLQNALEAAEHANKAKTIFLNNMSHDIRTPMNAIVGFTALASAHIDSKERVKDYLEKIATSSHHLLSLINDVLDMSRIESGKMKIEEKTVRLPDILHNLHNIVQSSAASKQLELFIAATDVENEEVICDPLRLNQVLLNLVSNAIKYTQPGGHVSIRLTQKPSQNLKVANYEFCVKDNGIGMSKEFADHVFDSFAREENSTVSRIQGTGLGMAITKSIVDMMGGTIEVKSEKGKGSEFTVNLPFALCEMKKSNDTIEELRNIRALVVDDDSDCCISVSEMLKKFGMRSDWTLSGHEAVLRAEVAKKEKDGYGVFVVDMVMPDMNGIETVRRIRRTVGDDLPIIVLTAYDWSDVEQEAMEAGVTAFCSKPIFMSELKEALSKPFAVHEKESETPENTEKFSGHRILLVEDNELNREIAVSLLEDYGFEVCEAEDGNVAVQRVESADIGYYEAVLMDVQMPVMDGYEATRRIRELADAGKAGIPIIAMTANAFEEDKRLALEAGMNGYLSKPIDIEAVVSELSRIIT